MAVKGELAQPLRSTFVREGQSLCQLRKIQAGGDRSEAVLGTCSIGKDWGEDNEGSDEDEAREKRCKIYGDDSSSGSR